MSSKLKNLFKSLLGSPVVKQGINTLIEQSIKDSSNNVDDTSYPEDETTTNVVTETKPATKRKASPKPKKVVEEVTTEDLGDDEEFLANLDAEDDNEDEIELDESTTIPKSVMNSDYVKGLKKTLGAAEFKMVISTAEFKDYVATIKKQEAEEKKNRLALDKAIKKNKEFLAKNAQEMDKVYGEYAKSVEELQRENAKKSRAQIKKENEEYDARMASDENRRAREQYRREMIQWRDDLIVRLMRDHRKSREDATALAYEKWEKTKENEDRIFSI